MNDTATIDAPAKPPLIKRYAAVRALLVTGPRSIAIRGGTEFNGTVFGEDTPLEGDAAFTEGDDLIVTVGSTGGPVLRRATGLADLQGVGVLGGFHWAPGGNAAGRSGGDSVHAINPCSVWDVGFRPACPDPRGMTLITADVAPFWCDIYLTAADHLAGTSRFGATIADGDDPPSDPNGSRFPRFDYPTAQAVMSHHGKQLLSVTEFFAAAYGVTEKTAIGRDPKRTGLDAPRTSKFGLMQATGNMWVWGHDGDPALPRPSLFGGSWLSDGVAGSRCAHVGGWPERSWVNLSARGRCDHLQLA